MYGAAHEFLRYRWMEKAGAPTPRVAHRIVSAGKGILIIGGPDEGRSSYLIEAFRSDAMPTSRYRAPHPPAAGTIGD